MANNEHNHLYISAKIIINLHTQNYFVILRNIFEMMRKQKKIKEQEEQLARFAKAMGHPTRIAILKFLASQNCCYFGDIQKELLLPIAKATVSQHLAQLKNVELIQGEIFHPKVKYCINPANWELAKKLFNELLNNYKKGEFDC